MGPSPARRFFAAAAGAAAGLAAAVALRRREWGTPSAAEPLEQLGGAWSGIGKGPGGRPVEVALVVARRGRKGLFGPQAFEVALRTRETVGSAPLERATSSDDLLAKASVVVLPAGLLVVESRAIRIELDPTKPDELRLLTARYWRAPDLDLDLVLARALPEGSP